ncbi:MAG: amino acid racemase [Phycisphaerae bacterium]|nr:amino acid racemase [Phycisphaerae bacterium]
MKTLGIVAHSAEGATLCFNTACRHGGERLRPFMHPHIVMSAIPMAYSIPAWQAGDHHEIARHLAEGVHTVARAGADFFICPDNTAHIVLEQIAPDLPIPGLHMPEVVAAEIARNGWRTAGLLGTKWTMTGPVYERVLTTNGIAQLIPDAHTIERLNDAIFAELCRGVFREPTINQFIKAAESLKSRGAECVILGCTEIPLIMNAENSPLPPLDSTRLLARKAVDLCIDAVNWSARHGWIKQ